MLVLISSKDNFKLLRPKIALSRRLESPLPLKKASFFLLTSIFAFFIFNFTIFSFSFEIL